MIEEQDHLAEIETEESNDRTEEPVRRPACGRLEQLRVLGELAPIAGIEPLLDWIGRSRKVTPPGGARLSDIRQLGEFLGIRVVGQKGARRPWDHLLFEGEIEAEDTGRAVGSMWDVPELATWWRALVGARQSPRVTPIAGRQSLETAVW